MPASAVAEVFQKNPTTNPHQAANSQNAKRIIYDGALKQEPGPDTPRE